GRCVGRHVCWVGAWARRRAPLYGESLGIQLCELSAVPSITLDAQWIPVPVPAPGPVILASEGACSLATLAQGVRVRALTSNGQPNCPR
ncbi:hypothetical protein NPN14_24145, partial [Vibrio parahaemolyticus]|uniref:hypothetical protein n=1 Tax=Vibrio parahaemolyticus TaxID=670 RepID=UPI002111A077